MNPNLDPQHPEHLRHDPMVAEWIREYQTTNTANPECQLCGWPHPSFTLCGMGNVFGKVKIGGQFFYVDSSNVAYLRGFILNQLANLGFHWRNQVYIARKADAVVVSRVEHFNNTPQLEQWTIPVAEFASMVCAASCGGETAERYQEILSFLGAESGVDHDGQR